MTEVRSSDDSHTIRPAVVADARALAELRYEFRAALGTPNEREPTFVARCEQWMRERLGARDAWHAWIAERSASRGIDGAIWLELIEKIPNPMPEAERIGYVTNLYVRPARRGGGTGSALLEVALAHCRAAHVETVVLWPSERSRPLYLRHGFSAPAEVLRLTLSGDRSS